MTEKPNNEGDGDDTVVRSPVRDSQPTRQADSSTKQPTVATPPAQIRPAGSSTTPSAPVPTPVRKDPSSKARARAAAAASGPAASVGLSAGNAPGAPSTAPAGPVTPSGALGPATPSKAATTPSGTPGTERAKAPTFTSAQMLGEPDDNDTQQIAKTEAGASGTESKPAAVKRAVGNPTTHRTRKARLRLAKVDPWSVMKTTFLFAIAFMIASLAAVMLLYGVISSSGVFDSINEIVGQVLAAPGDTTPFLIQDYLTTQRVAGFTIVIGVLNVVLITAIGTLAAFLYNLASSLLGGLEVTLAED